MLGASAAALADGARTAGRVPSGVTKVSIAISFPLTTPSGQRHKPVHVSLTRSATVAEAVAATNALPLAKMRGMCPMYMRIGPVLTVVFRNSGGSQLATATVDVTQGSKGDSGASACFPIRYVSSGSSSSLTGNSWVRLMGRLAGTAIS